MLEVVGNHTARHPILGVDPLDALIVLGMILLLSALVVAVELLEIWTRRKPNPTAVIHAFIIAFTALGWVYGMNYYQGSITAEKAYFILNKGS
jgi:hypothetical protein